MIEAELKAVVRDPGAVLTRLNGLAIGERAVYRDVYHDQPGGVLDGAGRELRVRTVETEAGVRTVLTYKEASTHASGSKPEWEMEVESADTAGEILTRLGYAPSTRLTKHCTNYRFQSAGRRIIATVVTVPELDGTWIEVETQADDVELDQALDVVRRVLADLGIDEECITSELYTDAVKAARSSCN
jgi:adenylate cyclase, class 2